MVIKSTRFTPEVLLGAPRRSAGVPNITGEHILYTVSTYSFSKHKKSEHFKLLERQTGESYIIATDKGIGDFVWLDVSRFLYLQSQDDGTDVYVATVNEAHNIASQHVKHIPAPASSLKVARLSKDEWAVVVAAEAAPDGSLYDEKTAKQVHSTGRLYDSTYVRHWDRYETKEKNALWYSKLSHAKGKYEMTSFINALHGSGLECPIRPFGGTDHFDVSQSRLIFVARDPTLKQALSTKSNVYLVQVDAWDQSPTKVEVIDIGGGAKSCPVFSADGRQAAFLGMQTDGYESDQNEIYVISEVRVTSKVDRLSSSEDRFWRLSPSALSWTLDSTALLVTAEDCGLSRLFSVPVGSLDKIIVTMLTSHDSVNEAQQLASGYIFTSGSSLIDNSIYQLVHCETGNIEWTDSNSGHGSRFGLHAKQIESIWTPASNPDTNKEVHSLVVRPSKYEKGKKYPVAYLIHGGPQGAWTDSWSTRWNPAVFAEQGYIVVCPNPTGSTGYGQDFTDAIKKNWGGDPYQDIVNVFDWVEDNLEGADNERAVALGGSYGGYMVNWIQGHDLGRKFKALVNHDGIFSTVGMLATDELYFPFQDLGGTPFYDPQAQVNRYQSWKQWDPTEHLDKWQTPTLVIHSARDFRIAIADGLATFNVLQARGVPSQFLTFPDENHWVLKPENSLVWHKTVFNWINKWVGLPPYAKEDNVEFFGGIKDAHETSAQMPTQGKPEM